MSIHPGIFSSQGPSGPSPAKAQGAQGCSVQCCPAGTVPSTLLFQSQLSPAPAARELHTKFLMGISWLPQPCFQSSPLQWDTRRGLLNPSKNPLETLQHCPGCAAQREHSPQPIHGPGFPQEVPSPRNSSCAAPGGAQRAKISTEEPNVPQFRVLQDFGWLWLGAGSVQFFPLSWFLPRLHSLIPKIQNEQGHPRGLRHLNTPQMCCFINPGVAEGLEAAGRD